MTMQRWTLHYLLNHEQPSCETTDEVSIKHVASGNRGLVLGEGSDLEVKDALHYRQLTLVSWPVAPVVTESWLFCSWYDSGVKVLFY